MRRFMIDLCLIILFVFLGRELLKESESQTIDERIEAFNRQVEQREVLDHVSHLHLVQKEENAAGKLGEALGELITRTVAVTVETIALFFDEN